MSRHLSAILSNAPRSLSESNTPSAFGNRYPQWVDRMSIVLLWSMKLRGENMVSPVMVGVGEVAIAGKQLGMKGAKRWGVG